LQEILRQTADTKFNKQEKIEKGLNMVLLKHFKDIAEDEIKDVRRMKAKHLGDEWKKCPEAKDEGGDVGDMILCDDYNVTQPGTTIVNRSGIHPLLAALCTFMAIFLLGTIIFVVYVMNKDPAPTSSICPPTNAPAASEWEFGFEFKDGKFETYKKKIE